MNNKWERLQSATRYSAAAAEKLNAAWKALFEMDNLLLDVEAIVSTMSKLVPGGEAGTGAGRDSFSPAVEREISTVVDRAGFLRAAVRETLARDESLVKVPSPTPTPPPAPGSFAVEPMVVWKGREPEPI